MILLCSDRWGGIVGCRVYIQTGGFKILDQLSLSPNTIFRNVLKGCFLNEPMSDTILGQIIHSIDFYNWL